MTTEPLVPCTCKVLVKRDRTLLSISRRFVHSFCPHHGLPTPPTPPKEKK